ncbi:toxin YoeB [Dyadobacter sp. SG02]|uniref:Txe/YoeB family addiction module toxin n=1 Tax=Dyadobacter sp. SG02 TaxID=1855291 RepID=UPI0008C3E4B9|nr:toxin YoeB [Dyadobacter sp. SG02]
MGYGKFQITFTEKAITHLSFWQKSGNKVIIKKIEQLPESISNTPAEGIGKPELLKHELAGRYSRRISHEHRIVYRVDGDTVYILSLKGNY